MEPTADLVWDTAEICHATRLSKSLVCRLLREGEIAGFRMGTKWLARPAAVAAYIQRVEQEQLGVSAA